MTRTIDIVRHTLEELEARHEKVAPLVEEVEALKRAIKDVRALLLRLEGEHDGSKSGQRTREWNPTSDSQAGRILGLLRANPRGLHTKVIARETEIAASSIDSVLPRLAHAGYVQRPTPGFYKITDEGSALGRKETPPAEEHGNGTSALAAA